MLGDQILHYSTDALMPEPWVQYSDTATNLLATHRPDAPKVQSIVLDKFYQIALTVDSYMTKRAWMEAGSFNAFNSVMLGWLRNTKRICDYTTLATYIGTTQSNIGNQTVALGLSTALTGLTGEEKARMEALIIAEGIANVLTDMKRPTRAYNDFGAVRSYSPKKLKVIWNAAYVNKLRKVDIPTIYNKDGLIDKFDGDALVEDYFGTPITATNFSTYSAATPTTGKPINSSTGAYTPGTNNANGTVRSLVFREVTVSGTKYKVYPGDELPAGATIHITGAQFADGETYIPTDTVICKIIYKDSVPLMSGFEVGTSFYNGRNHSTNHYLTYGMNTLEYLKDYPFITVTA